MDPQGLGFRGYGLLLHHRLEAQVLPSEFPKEPQYPLSKLYALNHIKGTFIMQGHKY